MKIIDSDTINIQWKNSQECAENVDHYLIFYKNLYTKKPWVLIGETKTYENMNFSISRDLLPFQDSIFEIGIRSVSKNGDTSAMAKSTESNIISSNGWFILWKHK